MFKKNLETLIQTFAPGSVEYANLHCKLFAADEVKRLMLEADVREWLTSTQVDMGMTRREIIEFEIEFDEVDATDEFHYLAGPNYCAGETPGPEYMKFLFDMQNNWNEVNAGKWL